MAWTKIGKPDEWDLTWDGSDPLTWDEMLMTWQGITYEDRSKVAFTKSGRPVDGDWSKT